jgi:hypothetical protein
MDGNPKQLIAQRIKDATNILVTVNRNPSVDQLAAALALTLMLNKLDKHATAVFSGDVPHAIDFLEPGKTFESNVSSLRDFIIALDKEKADRLRYKVEDGVVRIFITPYRTTITQNDLQFSEGDYNVELIIGLGVDNKDDLDEAVQNHGRILHDATAVTINSVDNKHTLGEIDWTDTAASSLSEMLMSLSESLKGGILDEQIANALLTGIVSATNRFSNDHTSPKVMTMAAQLMAAGANQQLITAQLQDSGDLTAAAPAPGPAPKKDKDGGERLVDGQSAKLKDEATQADAPKPNGEMHVEHTKPDALTVAEELAHQHQTPASESSAFDLPLPSLAPKPSVSDLQQDIAQVTQDLEQDAQNPLASVPVAPVLPPAPVPSQPVYTPTPPAPVQPPRSSDWRDKIAEPPSMGGTLNATTSEAEAAREAEANAKTNHTILAHGAPSGAQDDSMAMSYEETPTNSYLNGSKAKTLTPLSEPPRTSDFSGITLSELDAQNRQQPQPPVDVTPPAAAPAPSQPIAPAPSTVDDARAAVDAAFGGPSPMTTPAQPAYIPSTEPPVTTPATEQLTATPLPPLPDFSTLPPLPGEPAPPAPFPGESQPAPEEPAQPSAPNPGQFQIPGQQ